MDPYWTMNQRMSYPEWSFFTSNWGHPLILPGSQWRLDIQQKSTSISPVKAGCCNSRQAWMIPELPVWLSQPNCCAGETRSIFPLWRNNFLAVYSSMYFQSLLWTLVYLLNIWNNLSIKKDVHEFVSANSMATWKPDILRMKTLELAQLFTSRNRCSISSCSDGQQLVIILLQLVSKDQLVDFTHLREYIYIYVYTYVNVYKYMLGMFM